MACKFKTLSSQFTQRIWVPVDALNHIVDAQDFEDVNAKSCRDILARISTVRDYLSTKFLQLNEHSLEYAQTKSAITACNEILVSTKKGGMLKVTSALTMLPAIRFCLIKLRQGSISLLEKEKLQRDEISKMTKSLTDMDALCQSILKELLMAIRNTLAPFIGKEPPEDPQEQQVYFHYFHVRGSAIAGLDTARPLLRTLLRNCAEHGELYRFEKILLTQFEGFLETEMQTLEQCVFLYGGLGDSSQPSTQAAIQFFKKFEGALETRATGFYSSLDELQAYTTSLEEILSRYDDPKIRSQRDVVLKFINRVLLNEQQLALTASAQSRLLKMRERLKLQQQEKKHRYAEAKARDNEKRAQLWLEKYRASHDKLQESLALLSGRLGSFTPQSLEEGEEELKQIKDLLADLKIPTHSGNGKNPYAGIHIQVQSLRENCKSRAVELDEMFGKARRVARNLDRKLDRLFESEPTIRSSLRVKLLELVTTPELKQIVDEMYREGAVLGDGGTPAILLLEARLHVNCSPQSHFFKARYLRAQLEDLSDTNSTLTNIEHRLIGHLIKDLDLAMTEFTHNRHEVSDQKLPIKEITPSECLALLSKKT